MERGHGKLGEKCVEKVENGWGHGKMRGKWNKTEHEWEIRGTGDMLWERAIACFKK
jgi:hypothetical protein